MHEHVTHVKSSITEESGGEEILYPRQTYPSDTKKKGDGPPRAPDSQAQLLSATVPSSPNAIPQDSILPVPPEQASPPSAFSPILKAKKRTSDEFLMDQTSGHIASKSAPTKDESSSALSPSTVARKHRSLGTSSSPSIRANRRRVTGTGVVVDLDELHVKTTLTSSSPGKHIRHASASTSSSSSDAPSRRNFNHNHADFSHLPPSPSSSSIQQFLRANPSNGQMTNVPASNNNDLLPSPSTIKPPSIHSSPSAVAHSLLRGTQEGWPALDDKDATEVLRKLDGLSGKTIHARSSMSFKSTSRPGTPGRGGMSSQWEGIETRDKLKRHSSTSSKTPDDVKSRRSSAGSGKDHEQRETISGDGNDVLGHLSSDEVSQTILTSATPSRSGRPTSAKETITTNARSSLSAKRGSASSTNFGSTPTTSSRDSTTFSTSTSATSARSSFSKARRNSGGSDASSIHSNDAGSLRDRVAGLAAMGGDNTEEQRVPPVPPLPKDLGSYKPAATAPVTTINLPSSNVPSFEDQEKAILQDASGVPSLKGPVSRQSIPSPIAVSQAVRSPSKKWSISGALNKLQSASSREFRQTTSISTERPISLAYTSDNVNVKHDDSNVLVAAIPSNPPFDGPINHQRTLLDNDSLTARSSMSSLRVPISASTSPAGYRDRSPSFSSSQTPDRPETASSVGTHTTGQPSLSPGLFPSQNNRLTPSAIPYARRPSSQSSQSLYQQAERTSTSTLPSVTSTPVTNVNVLPSKTVSPAQPSKAVSQTPLSPTTRKSVFSLLKVSSSRKNLLSQLEKEKDREEKRERQSEKEKERRQKKEDDKDRSESRISVLMGRKRGKVSQTFNVIRGSRLCYSCRPFLRQIRSRKR